MEWSDFPRISTKDWVFARRQFHLGVQNVAIVGRTYLPESENDENAILHWIPGFWRMAGQWVKGEEKTIRSSISFEDFNLYLVDQKVSTLAHFPLQDKTHNQLMIWLEEQILSLGLFSKHLNQKLPYSLPGIKDLAKEKFEEISPALCKNFGQYYHNTYLILNELKKLFPDASSCRIWPHHFDEAMTYVLKESGDPATNTSVSAGFSPGDQYYQEPYFYVNSWPYVEPERLIEHKMGIPHEKDWVGFVLKVSDVLNEIDQYEFVYDFMSESMSFLSNILLD